MSNPASRGRPPTEHPAKSLFPALLAEEILGSTILKLPGSWVVWLRWPGSAWGEKSKLSDELTGEVSGGLLALPNIGPHRQKEEDAIPEPLHEIRYVNAQKPG